MPTLKCPSAVVSRPERDPIKMNLIEWPYFSESFLRTQGLNATFSKRFWSKVSITNGCWLWLGSKTDFGYGVLSTGIERSHRNWFFIVAHRASWILHYGPIPRGLQVLHQCDNPTCVNPRHLWLGTQSDNIQDAMRKGRHYSDGFPQNDGETNPMSVLSEKDVLAIRRHYTEGTHTQKMLSVSFGIDPSQISRIVNGKAWKHIH